MKIDEKVLAQYRKYYREDDPIVEQYRKYFEEGTPDIVIAAEARFIDDGEGLECYDSDEEFYAASEKEERLKEER